MTVQQQQVTPVESGRENAARPGQALQAAALVSAEAPKSAELSQGTLQAASSLNTGSAIAGPKPWSKEWVFNGTEEANPDLRTLFDKANSEGNSALVRELLARISSVELPNRQEAAGSATPKSTQRSASEREVARKSADQLQSPAPAVMGGDTAILQSLLQAGSAGGIPAALLRDAQEIEARSENEESVDAWAGEAMPKRAGSEIAGQSAARSVSGAEYLEMLQGVRGRVTSEQPNEGRMSPLQARSSERRMEKPIAAAETKIASNAAAALPGELRSKQGAGLKGPRTSGSDSLDEFVRAFEAQRAGVQAASSGISPAVAKPVPMMLNAQVTQGSRLRDRLSSDALAGLSSGIRGLGPQGGGEIRMRLKPDGIGEVHLRVVARGNDVGLKIQASNENAKKILEESLGFLKESLAQSQLNLVRTDVSVGSMLASNDAGSGQQQQQQQHGQSHSQPEQFGAGQQTGQFGANFGQSGGSRQGLWSGDADDGASSRSAGGAHRMNGSFGLAAASAARSPVETGRLDVMA